MNRGTLILLVVLALGSSSGGALLCAWSCAVIHATTEMAEHHDCEEPAANAVMIGSGAHCEEHSVNADLVAVGALSAQSAQTVGIGVVALQRWSTTRSGALVVIRRGADPPSSRSPAVLRI